jgi:hypothetical protein
VEPTGKPASVLVARHPYSAFAVRILLASDRSRI